VSNGDNAFQLWIRILLGVLRCLRAAGSGSYGAPIFEDRSTFTGQLFTITGIFVKVQKAKLLLLALERVSALNF
jgi:hypothetical protein